MSITYISIDNMIVCRKPLNNRNKKPSNDMMNQLQRNISTERKKQQKGHKNLSRPYSPEIIFFNKNNNFN